MNWAPLAYISIVWLSQLQVFFHDAILVVFFFLSLLLFIFSWIKACISKDKIFLAPYFFPKSLKQIDILATTPSTHYIMLWTGCSRAADTWILLMPHSYLSWFCYRVFLILVCVYLPWSAFPLKVSGHCVLPYSQSFEERTHDFIIRAQSGQSL